MSVPGAVTDASRVHAEPIQFRSGRDTIQGYLARPAHAGPAPAVIVIHEAFGLVDHIRDLARRFANAGVTALAPDLYSRTGGPNPDDRPSVMAAMFALPDAQVVGDLEAAAGYLRGLDGVTDRIGVVGFCSGGRQTLLFACSSPRVNAAVDCWGGFISRATPSDATTATRPTPVIDLVDRLSCPLFAVFGAEDENPSVAEAEELRARAQRAGKNVTVKIYPNAGHAFLADYRPSYCEAPATELWGDMLAFFERHLR